MSDSNNFETPHPPPYSFQDKEKSQEIERIIEEKNDIPEQQLFRPPSYDEFSEETLEEIIKTFRTFMKRRFTINKNNSINAEKQYNILKTEFVQLCECELFISECRKKYMTAMKDTFEMLKEK